MNDLGSNDSVRNEQFGKSENTENKNETPSVENSAEQTTPEEEVINTEDEKVEPAVNEEAVTPEDAEDTTDDAVEETPKVEEVESTSNDTTEVEPNTAVDEAEVVEPTAEKVTTTEEETATETEVKEEVAKKEEVEEETTEPVAETQEVTQDKVEEAPEAAETKDKAETEVPKNEDAPTEEENKEPEYIPVDYTKLNKDQLVNTLEIIISTVSDIESVKDDVEMIKTNFYKLLRTETDKKKEQFIEDGGKEEDFKLEQSPMETRLKELLGIYRDKRENVIQRLEAEKQGNLDKKYEIIEAIKELVNKQESLNKTFQEFRDLQDAWRAIGAVPQNNVKELWEKYHFQVEAFYDYIKINKELRDLDFKKNLENKLKLCEQAEELLLEPSVVEAFRKLQQLHDVWRETGPVPADKRAEIWERFKEATSKINKKHQEYFVNLKQEQKNNLEEKTALCEKVEEILTRERKTAKDWEGQSKEIIEIQKVWKTIGFAPKKQNTKIYERFRLACDKFFDEKRGFFAHSREEHNANLQLKTELCLQAEALKDSTDWRKTTDEYIALQKKWKEIGPVPSKQSEKIWKRFRGACDVFFQNKSKHFANIDETYVDNLKAKKELIEEIKAFELGEEVQENLDKLKKFQRRWADIGFVPIKEKEAIQEEYRGAINEKFDKLRLDEGEKELLKFRTKINNIASKPNAGRRLSMEREKCFNKLNQLKNDISLWENNIGFFSNSKNAESMIKDVNIKITQAQKKIEGLKQKINIIDEIDY